MEGSGASSGDAAGVVSESAIEAVNQTLAYIKELKPQLEQMISLAEPKVLAQMRPLMRAKTMGLLADATTTIYALRLRCNGVDPDDHRVQSEIERLNVYREKFQQCIEEIKDVPLVVVKEWNPITLGYRPDLTNFPTWVDFRKVPDFLFSHKGLFFLGNLIGHSHELHPFTENCVRLDVARVLVTINLEKELPHTLLLDSCIKVDVSYPCLPPKCKQCNGWGHISDECCGMKKGAVVNAIEIGGKSSAIEGGVPIETTLQGKEVVNDVAVVVEKGPSLKGKELVNEYLVIIDTTSSLQARTDDNVGDKVVSTGNATMVGEGLDDERVMDGLNVISTYVKKVAQSAESLNGQTETVCLDEGLTFVENAMNGKDVLRDSTVDLLEKCPATKVNRGHDMEKSFQLDEDVPNAQQWKVVVRNGRKSPRKESPGVRVKTKVDGISSDSKSLPTIADADNCEEGEIAPIQNVANNSNDSELPATVTKSKERITTRGRGKANKQIVSKKNQNMSQQPKKNVSAARKAWYP